MHTARMSFVCALVLLLLSPVAFSQSSAAGDNSSKPDGAQEALKLSTDLVVIDAQIVRKKTGQAIGELRREDFLISEDGVRQEIAHFSQDQLPLSILLLLDTSGSVWDIINDVRDRAVEALGHLKEADEVALMATASRTALIQDFTTDRKILADKIATIDKEKLGRDGILLHEAVYQAAKHLNQAANPASRRVIIVITDNISTQKIGQGHSESAALEEVYETGVAVCGLKVNDLNALVLELNPLYYGLKGLLFRGDIRSYADKTGGVVLSTSRSELDRKLTELINSLRTRYTLAYTSTNSKSDGKFRKIKLQLTPEVEKREGKPAIITRKGYYARKPEAVKKRGDAKADAEKNF